MHRVLIAAFAAIPPAFALYTAPLAAQRWQVDLGGSRVEFDNSTTLSAASVAPFIEWAGGIVYASLWSSLAAFDESEWGVQGRGDISLLSPRLAPTSLLRVEFLGTLSGTYHSSEYRTAATRGEARLHVAGRRAGLWVGGVGGTGWTSDTGGVATSIGPTLGVWGRETDWAVAAVFTPLRIEGFWFPELDARVSATIGPADVLGFAGWRDGAGASGVGSSAWGGISASLWFAERAALVLAGGNYPSDLLQGLPSGRFVSAAIRVTNRRATTWTYRPSGRPIYDRERDGGTLRFSVPGAGRVQVVGDWTGWEPVPLLRASDGGWVLGVELAPGVYRFNLIVDGDRWIVPEGVIAVDDGFGGQAGLLIVSG